MVYVSLAWIKNADWYHKTQFIQKERADKTQELLNDAFIIVKDMADEMTVLENNINKYKIATIVAGTVTLISIIFHVYNMYLWREIIK